MSLRKVLENELRARDYWTDLMSLLPADRVIEVAVKFLDHAIYQLRDVSLRLKWVMKKKKKRDSSDSDSELLDNGVSDLSESSVEEEELSDEDNDEVEERKKLAKKKGKEEKKRVNRHKRGVKESKEEEKPLSDHLVHTNIDDLAECFRHLELKLGEWGGSQTQPPKMRMAMYCIMCGQSRHGICKCSKSKFFITRGICRMDVNNRVVMGDGSTLPRADGEGSTAKQIHNLLLGNIPLTSNLTSALNIEVVAVEADYYDELNELAVLGSLDFDIFLADRAH